MANICTNKFYMNLENCSEKEANSIVDEINKLLNEKLEGVIDYADEGTYEGWFDSRWDFPMEILGPIFEGTHAYFRCLSEEYGCEYVAMNIYNGDSWEEEQCFNF